MYSIQCDTYRYILYCSFTMHDVYWFMCDFIAVYISSLILTFDVIWESTHPYFNQF